MYHTFSLRGTKDGFLLLINENIDYDLLFKEIEECFSLETHSSGLISSIEIKGHSLPISVQSTLEHLIIRSSDGKMTVKKEEIYQEKENQFSFSATLRSGEFIEFQHSVIVRGNVNSGAILSSKENALVLGNLHGTVWVPEGKQIYVGKRLSGQIRIGTNIYFPTLRENNGVWLYEKDGRLCLENNGGNISDE